MTDLFDLLDGDQGREELADLLGQLRVALGLFRQAGPLAAAVAGGELLGQPIEQVVPSRVVQRHGSEALPAIGPPGQDRLVSLPGPAVLLGGGLLADPRDRRRLGAAELLEVSQGDHFPVKGREAVQQ
jgi:hypothetical protein